MSKPYMENIKLFTILRRSGVPEDVNEEIQEFWAVNEMGGDNSYARESPESLKEANCPKTADFLIENGVSNDEDVLLENPC